MKYLIPILMLAALTMVRAKATEGETASVRFDSSDWRSALLAQYPYKPTGTAVAANPAVFRSPAPVDHPDVVVLEPFVVRQRGADFGELEKTFRAQEESACSAALNRKFGVEKHVYTFGRNHRFMWGYLSLFHIPVAAGFSW